MFILISRHKTKPDTWKNAGPYRFPKKSDFGSIRSIRRNNTGYDFKVVTEEACK